MSTVCRSNDNCKTILDLTFNRLSTPPLAAELWIVIVVVFTEELKYKILFCYFSRNGVKPGSNQAPTQSNNEQQLSPIATDLKILKQNEQDSAATAVQLSKATIRERNCSMFNNEMLSDVHFQVGPPGKCTTLKLVYIHKWSRD